MYKTVYTKPWFKPIVLRMQTMCTNPWFVHATSMERPIKASSWAYVRWVRGT